MSAVSSKSWVDDVVWWQVYPLGFVGAEVRSAADTPAQDTSAHDKSAHGEPANDTPAPHDTPSHDEPGHGEPGHGEPRHRLRRLHAWLDYAVELGASGLALGPVFASRTHGYDTVDHFRVDPRLGDDADLDALFVAAHDRGLKVLLDGVFNHVGQEHPAWQVVLAEGPSAPTAPWFRLSWPEPWRPGLQPGHETFEGHGQLIALNHDEPAVEDLVVQVMTHWLARGADGWRLDAAYAVPTSFWSRVSRRVRAAHPQVYLVGEVIHGDYADLVRASGLDAVTQYELWKSIWSSLNDGNLFELAWTLKRHNDFLDEFVPLTFVGNHDVTRLASRLADDRLLAHALVVLFTIGGTPSIYAGDEQAFRGVKENRAGGDDAVRPAFPADPSGLAPYGWPVYRLHQQLIGLRRRHPWLRTARTTALHLTNLQLSYRVDRPNQVDQPNQVDPPSQVDQSNQGGRGNRANEAGQQLVVALNLGDDQAELPTPGARAVLAGSAELIEADSPQARVHLAARGWAILEA